MKRILVIDDNTDLLLSLKLFLSKEGYEVKTSTSCKDGLHILSAFAPQLVLLDINVGDEDGRDMCRQIKSQAEFRHIPVVLISANLELLGRFKEYGANHALPKPFSLSSLLTAVERSIGP